MPVKPILMSDLRRIAISSPAAKHRNNTGTGSYNRFAPIGPRIRLPSTGKRLLSPENNDGNMFKFPKLDANLVFSQLQGQDIHIDNAKKNLAAASDVISANFKADDGGIGTVLSNLASAVENLLKGNDILKSSVIDLCKAPTGPATPKPAFNFSLAASSQPAPTQKKTQTAKPTPTPEENLTAKVKRTLREAERRTIIFDLDLGPTPTINKETISRKVTVALHDKAKEGKHDWNVDDAAEMVDDALSCSQLEFLGSGTRKFYNNRKKDDPRNGKMCTIPVRMDFKNKETKLQAETTLRSVCKVSCSTPYPKRLRQLINGMIQNGKNTNPDCFIKIKVDIDNLMLTAHARKEDTWIHLKLDTVIPLDILDRNLSSDTVDDVLAEINPIS